MWTFSRRKWIGHATCVHIAYCYWRPFLLYILSPTYFSHNQETRDDNLIQGQHCFSGHICISDTRQWYFGCWLLLQRTKALNREITGLDITMQPLIQDIFSQIIDSSPYFPERLCDFSCMRFPFKTKQKVLSHVNSFCSEIYKKCQKWFWKFEPYMKWNFCNL